MTTESRWKEVIPLDFDKLPNVQQLQNADLDYLCKLDLTEISPEFEYARLRELLDILQQGLRKSVVDREAALYAKGRADQLLAESRRIDSPVGPPGVVQPDAIRARDQHILYLQYEVSQRDLQMQQLGAEAQHSRTQIETLQEEKRLLEEEVQHVRGQISKARDESDELRQSIDEQLKKADAREHLHSRNDELIDALEEAKALRLETQRLKKVCAHLEEEMKDAVVQIDSATAQHLRLKGLVQNVETTCQELREENADLQEKLNRKRIESSIGMVRSPEASQTASNADDQLDQLIAVVNKRVDEWKVLMQNETGDVSNTTALPGRTSSSVGEMESLLTLRSREVSLLRSSLASAVDEIEEGAKTIRRLREQGRRVSEDKNTDVRTQLSDRTAELSGMLKRTLAFEDDLDMCQRENKELNFQIQRYEEGVYGLPEARNELKHSQAQLLSRDKYIRELVRRLNALTSDYDTAVRELNEMRRQSGLPPRPPASHRDLQDVAPLLEGRLLVEVLEEQVDRLENERVSLRRVIYSLMEKSEEEDPEAGRQHQKESSLRLPDTAVEGLLADLKRLRQNFDDLAEENSQLERGMQEILHAIKNSRVKGHDGESVELRSSSLEQLLDLMARRRLPSSDSAYTEVRLDSAVYSEPDNSQGSTQTSALRDKIEGILTSLEEISTRTNRQLMAERTPQIGSLNVSDRVSVLFTKGIQDVLKLALDNDPRSLDKLVHGHQQEIRLLLDDTARMYENRLRDAERAARATSSDRIDHSRQEPPSRRSFQHPTAPYPDLTDELRDAEIRLARTADRITALTSENHKLRSQLTALSGQSYSEITQNLTALEKDHRNEVETLSRMNGDLRADSRRQHIHLADLRSALQTANEQLVDLTVELKHAQMRSSSGSGLGGRLELGAGDRDGGRQEEGSSSAGSAGVEYQRGDGVGMEVRQRVIAQLEAKIQRLENEMRQREEDRQKDRDEFVEILMKSGKSLQGDLELSKQVAGLNAELGQKDRRIDILSQQHDNAKSDMQETSERFARREEELRQERENMVSDHEKTTMRLRDEISKLKLRGISSSLTSVPPVPPAPDTGRTFTQPVTAPTSFVPDSRLIKSLTDQLADKEQELRKLSAAFRAFKEEMTSAALPSSDPTVVSQLALQKREMQNKLQAAQDANVKVLADLRKQKLEASSMVREVNDLRTECRQKDERLRRFEVLNGEMSTRIASLENDVDRARNGLTDDDRTVAALKKKLAQLEKDLAKSKSRSPVRSASAGKSEVLVWEEKKKWEKIVQKLREKLKEKDGVAETLQATVGSTKNALSRSERERALMEKRLTTLNKRVSDMSQQPSLLHSLDTAQKEIEELTTLVERQTEEREILKERFLNTQAEEQSYASALKVANDRLSHLLQSEKTQSQKYEILRDRSQKKIKSLEKRISELETAIAQTNMTAPADVSVPKEATKDMVAAVRTLKDVIDHQQVELQHLRKQNSSLKAIIKQTEEGRPEIQRQKKKPSLEERVRETVVTPDLTPLPGREISTKTRQPKLKGRQTLNRESGERVGGDILRLRREFDLPEEKDEGISISKDSYDPNRRVAELEAQLANILGQPVMRKEKSGTKRRPERQ